MTGLDGQTTVHPCAWCGEPAEREVFVEKARVVKDALGRPATVPPLYRWACHVHARPIIAGPVSPPRRTGYRVNGKVWRP